MQNIQRSIYYPHLKNPEKQLDLKETQRELPKRDGGKARHNICIDIEVNLQPDTSE